MIDAEDSLWIAGFTDSFGTSNRGDLILKFSSDGELLKALMWGQVGYDDVHSLKVNERGEVWVAGSTTANALLLQFSSAGKLLQALTLDGGGWEAAHSLVIDGQNEIWLAGSGSSFNGGSGVSARDIFLVKFDSRGG